jgi:molybdopterin converting factor small subunit
MAKVSVPTLLRPLCDGRRTLEVPASTLEQLLRALDVECPGFYDRVVEDGAVRPELAVAIDSEAAAYPLFEPLRPDAEVTIVPAIGGG